MRGRDLRSRAGIFTVDVIVRRRSALLGLVLSQLVGGAFTQAAPPATVAEAAAVLDLSVAPLIDPVEEPVERRVAAVTYRSTGAVDQVAEALRQQLKGFGLVELEGATITPAYASASYQKGGFTFVLTVLTGSMPNEATVSIKNLGNIDLKALPVPKHWRTLYALPQQIMLVTEEGVEEAKQSVSEMFVNAGWTPYGSTTVSQYYKQNAVRLQSLVQAAPGQGGKTTVTISSEQLSADLPTPADAMNLQYTDGNGRLNFESGQSFEELVAFYKEALAESGWKATTENPIKIGFRRHLIFRNPGQEYLEIKIAGADPQRVEIVHQSAPEFVASEKRAEEAARKKLEQQEK